MNIDERIELRVKELREAVLRRDVAIQEIEDVAGSGGATAERLYDADPDIRAAALEVVRARVGTMGDDDGRD